MHFVSFVKVIQCVFVLVLILPVGAGLLGMLLPAFNYFPALERTSFSFDAFTELFHYDGIWKMAVLSLSTGLISTLLALIGSIAIIATFYQRRTLQAVQRWLSPMLVIPHAAAAIALAFIFTPSGWAGRIVSSFSSTPTSPPDWAFPNDGFGIAVILALTLKELPFILLMALSVLSQPQLADTFRKQLNIAQSLGYGRITAFIKIVLPILYRLIKLPLLGVLAFASASVEIPLILGPNQPATLSVAILQWFNHVDIDMRIQASATACLQVIVTLLVLALWVLIEKIGACYSHCIFTNGKRNTFDHIVKWFAYSLTFTIVTIVILTTINVVLWSFATYWQYPDFVPDSLTFIHWQEGLSALKQPLLNTIWLGLGVSIVAVILTTFTLEAESYQGDSIHKGKLRFLKKIFSKKILQYALFLPLLVPGVAFLYGLVWFQQLLLPNATWFHVFISHLLYVLPYVFLSLAVAYRRLDKRYINVAYSLGATPAKVFWQVKVPMLFSPIMVALALGLAISYSQYLPTLLASGGRIATVTTEAVAASSGASRRLSAVYVLVQIIIPLAGFILAWWLPTRIFNPSRRDKKRENHV